MNGGGLSSWVLVEKVRKGNGMEGLPEQKSVGLKAVPLLLQL